ncbi:MAG: holo-ACP synthase [Candidatus Omnitrophica bacterium]|nr:holo-ACP synthase [Candidatus Omnitrophota bacterium]MBU1367440.1 holo-ACP synthase [Candidatus Omnitrophota bacterium]MBU1810681.1 holo-ACP synthase [Candidatus Omnitrophota bacterium]
MIKIEKMKKAIQKWKDGFLSRVFNKEEIENIYQGKMYYQRLGARFAAKEAVIKAISKEHPLALTDILILNKENGAPYCTFKKDIDVKIFLSITHIEDYAVACAVAEKKS